MASRSKTTAARCVVGTALGAAVALWGGTHLLSRRRARWRPGAGVVSRHGPLSIRTFGDGDPIVVLLPGIAASGSFYGAAFDQLGDIATVLVIDPLGFGQSMVEPDGDALFGISDHQNAIIDVLSSSPLASRPVTLVGHSMGASLAIITAAAAADTAITIAGVIAFDAPLFVSEQEARQRISGMGWFETLLASGPIAHLVCSWMCRHRRFASYAAIAVNPSLPITVARDGVRHTWLSYSGALNSIVMSDDWLPALEALGRRNIAVLLVNGTDDPVPVPGLADRLARSYPNLTVSTHRGGHQLPLSDPDWCAETVARAINGDPS
ncbi:alpha/beta hydrolase [Microbacterium foliorum]|uniref:Pimeloyl-ACP methyl ester carboxylesterase n=2 Tax=Microbacteriaceae TaxID=85023 RepID=A0A1H4RIR1_9MICO|nr:MULTISPECIES: alpha/beta hydrolase [Microbacterium]SEC31688.1 Pimeloyl-ACP methyl ester carboxylesterase [Microbacterium hydrocarbonoxydans]